MRNIMVVSILTLLLAACGVNDGGVAVAPQLLDQYPEPGATDVRVNTSVWATFDSAVDEEWVNGSFTLEDASGSTLTVDVSYDPITLTATLTPSAPLAYNTTYEAAFTADIGLQGSIRALAEDVSWTFTTDPNEPGGDGEPSTSEPVSDCDASGCTYRNVTLEGNITVPDGATWTLENVTVNGNLTVGSGATVIASNVVVEGKFEAVGAAKIVLTDSTVTQQITLTSGGTVELLRVSAESQTLIDRNTGPVSISDSWFSQKLQANENTGGVDIHGNAGFSDLNCEANDPAPTGADNDFRSGMTGQCAAL